MYSLHEGSKGLVAQLSCATALPTSQTMHHATCIMNVNQKDILMSIERQYLPILGSACCCCLQLMVLQYFHLSLDRRRRSLSCVQIIISSFGAHKLPNQAISMRKLPLSRRVVWVFLQDGRVCTSSFSHEILFINLSISSCALIHHPSTSFLSRFYSTAHPSHHAARTSPIHLVLRKESNIQSTKS